MTTLNFGAAVRDWSEKAKRNMQLVMRQSVQDLFAEAQKTRAQGGKMPVDTGFLRNSFQTTINGTTALTGQDSYKLAIGDMELGDRIEGGWTAKYARRIEYGFQGADSRERTFNQNGHFFARGASEKWQPIVDSNAAKLKD